LAELGRVRPRLTMLDRDDCLRLHQASCRILHETGVRVYSPAGLALLRQGGARTTAIGLTCRRR
jgi:trimethylamine:corrinoid methyltransferase-like protein